MSKSLTQITVFVSGTSETYAEKSALRTVVGELNPLLERSSGITLRLLEWPVDFRPGANSDGQAEINRQAGTNYDVYVGLLGVRFGTPTQRAGSGTEEEFEAALKRFHSDTTTVRVLFYFKRAIDDAFAVDLQQLEKVKTFRSALPSRGILYQDFREISEFAGMVRDHLHGLITDEWHDGRWIQIANAEPAVAELTSKQLSQQAASTSLAVSVLQAPEELSEVEDADLGYLEYMAAFQESIGPLGETLTRIGEHGAIIGDQLKARTAEAEALQAKAGLGKPVGTYAQQKHIDAVIAIANGAAEALDDYASAMAPDVARFRSLNRLAFGNLALGTDEAIAQFADAKESTVDIATLETLINTLESARTSTAGFESTIRQVPALTGRVKRARQRVSSQLGELIAEMSFSIEKAKQIVDRLKGAKS